MPASPGTRKIACWNTSNCFLISKQVRKMQVTKTVEEPLNMDTAGEWNYNGNEPAKAFIRPHTARYNKSWCKTHAMNNSQLPTHKFSVNKSVSSLSWVTDKPIKAFYIHKASLQVACPLSHVGSLRETGGVERKSHRRSSPGSLLRGAEPRELQEQTGLYETIRQTRCCRELAYHCHTTSTYKQNEERTVIGKKTALKISLTLNKELKRAFWIFFLCNTNEPKKS